MMKKCFTVALTLCLLLTIGFGTTSLAAQEPAQEVLAEVGETQDGTPESEGADIIEVPAEEATAVSEANPEAEAELAATDLPYVAGEVVVVFESGADSASVIAVNGGELVSLTEMPGVGDVALIKIPQNNTVAQAIGVYNGKPGVRYAESNFKYTAFTEQSKAAENEQPQVVASSPPTPSVKSPSQKDPMLDQQWYLDKINVSAATNIIDSLPARDKVLVAIVDSAVDLNHEDLTNIYNKELCRNFINGVMEPYPKTAEGDEHGSHVSGIIAAQANNGKGIAGVASGSRNQIVELMSSRALTDDAGGTNYNISMGIYWAVKCGADVINMSLGGAPGYPPTGEARLEEEVIDLAVNMGAVVVTAAGNEDTDSYVTPSDFDSSISVIATTNYSDPKGYCKTAFSNFGTSKDISAPGERILSTIPNNKYEYFNGTSMASPVVAGVAAMMRYAHPGMKPQDVKAGLETTATDLFRTGYDTTTAWGNVNAEAAVRYALKEDPPVPPTPVMAQSPNDTAATNLTATSIRLDWSEIENADGFFIFRSEGKYKSDFSKYEIVGKNPEPNMTTFTDTELETGKRYCYTVVGYLLNEQGEEETGMMGNTLYATPKCMAPTGFKAAGQNASTIKVSWNSTEGADGYYLYRSTTKTGGYKLTAKFAGGEGANYYDKSLKKGTKYYYKLIAITNTDSGVVKGITAGPVAGQTKSE